MERLVGDVRNLIVAEFVEGFSRIMLALTCRAYHALLSSKFAKTELKTLVTEEICSTGSVKLFTWCSQLKWKFDPVRSRGWCYFKVSSLRSQVRTPSSSSSSFSLILFSFFIKSYF